MDETPDNEATVSLRRPGDEHDAAHFLLKPESKSGNALPIGTRLGEFEVRGVIGEGGFSVVYLAWDHSLHRNVALKEYIPVEFAMRDAAMRVTARSTRHRETFDIGLKSFVNEARLLASFDHQSLVKVHRFWEDRGTAFMVMPWYQGPTLKQALATRQEPPDEAWLLRMLDSLTEALSVLHAEQCFHRDIAPDNIILLGPAETPLLLDFGAARRVIGSVTHHLTAILKNGYAPLEQYGDIPGMRQGPWTDIYALASVAHFAIRGSTPPPAVGRLVNETWLPLRGSFEGRYSDRLLSAIDNALAVRPEERTQSIASFRRQLGLDGELGLASAQALAARNLDLAAFAPSSEDRPVAPASRVFSGRRLSTMSAAVVCAVAVIAGARWWSHEAADPVVAAASPAPADPKAADPIDSALNDAPPAAGIPPTHSGGNAAVSSAPRAANGLESGAADASPEADRIARAKALQAEARRSASVALADLQQLARAERRDVRPQVREVRSKQDSAQAALRAGRVDDAVSLEREGGALATQALNGLVGELVRGYAKVAEDATAANEFEIAQLALNQARKVDALKR